VNKECYKYIEVLSFIEKNLDVELDIDQLCAITFLSKFHFHRQCSAFFGMSVMNLVRLLRLKRAGFQLAFRHEIKIIDISLDNGYASQEAFTRAFKKHYNQSPLDFRKAPNWHFWQAKYASVLNLRTRVMSQAKSKAVNIVDYPETLVAVMEHRAAPHLLNHTIQSFIEWRTENCLTPGNSKTFNLLYDDPNLTAADDYRFDLCCSIDQRISDSATEVVNKIIPAGKCAVIRHVGSDDNLAVVIDYLYSKWLNQSGYEIRDFPLFLERVSFFPDVLENNLITDVYLPIE
jgi:AraC family transcriptional regulator